MEMYVLRASHSVTILWRHFVKFCSSDIVSYHNCIKLWFYVQGYASAKLILLAVRSLFSIFLYKWEFSKLLWIGTLNNFCRTCFNIGDLGMQVSVRSFIRPSSTFTLGVLWAQLILQFCIDLFDNLHVFSSWYGDVHVVWIYCWIIFCHFSTLWTVTFRPQCIDSGYLVSATPHTILYQSFWNFAYVFSMVWFGYNPCVNFCHFFTLWTLPFSDLRFYESIYSWYLVSTTLHTIYTDLF